MLLMTLKDYKVQYLVYHLSKTVVTLLHNFVVIICAKNAVKIINIEKLVKFTIHMNNILDKSNLFNN